MKLTLEIRQKCNFFWLRGIRRARIDKCCAQCFIGEAYHEIYEGTRYKDKALVEFDIPHDDTIKAYYLCGLSRGFCYDNNTHVAFVPYEGQNIEIDNDKIRLVITDTLTPEAEQATTPFNLVEELLSDAAQIWDFADEAQKRRIMQSLISRVILTDDDVKIEWAF